MALSIEEILAADDKSIQSIEVPEWHGTVKVRRLAARDLLAFQSAEASQDSVIRFVAACLCDNEGKPIAPHPEHLQGLADKSGSALMRVFKVASEINGLSDDINETMRRD